MITNGIVGEDDIKIGRIRDLLSAETNNLSEICTKDNINMWSKRKPFKWPVPIYGMNAEQLAATHYGLKYQVNPLGTAGSTDGTYGSLPRMLNDARAGYLPTVVWDKPDEDFRLGDFYDYDHYAKAPITPADAGTYNVSREGDFSVGFYINPTGGESRSVRLHELGLGSITSFGNWYFGVLMYNDSKAYAVTQETKLSTVYDSVSVTFHDLADAFSKEEGGESVHLLPFFSTQVLESHTIGSINTIGSFYPLGFAAYDINVKGYNTLTDTPYTFVGNVAAVRFTSFPTSVFVNFAIRNNVYSDATRSLKIYGYSTFTGGISMLLYDGEVTVPQRSTWYSSSLSQYPTGSQLWRIDGTLDQAFYDGLTKIEVWWGDNIKSETLGAIPQTSGDPNDP